MNASCLLFLELKYSWNKHKIKRHYEKLFVKYVSDWLTEAPNCLAIP